MSQSIIFNQFTKSIIHGNRVILGNRRNGKWIKISKECYEILKLAEAENATTNELIEAFEDKGDQEYFKELLRLLFKEDLLAAQEELVHFDNDLSIDIAVTNRCNLKCKHCCVDADLTNFVITSYSIHYTKLYDGNQAPDFMWLSQEYVPQYESMGVLASLDEPLAKADFNQDDYFPGALSYNFV